VLCDALADVADLRADPAPETRLLAFQDHGIRYAVRYWLTAFDRRDAVSTAVHRAIWYHLRRAGIRFAYPAADVHLHQPAPAGEATDARVRLLREITFLGSLSAEQMQQLAGRLHPALFASRETICRQGEPGQSFYLIARGRVQVSVRDDGGREVFSQILQAGNFFGEFSLLTGEPRSATVTAAEGSELLVMDKEDMRQALEATPQLAEHISAVLAQRQHELQEHRARMPVAAGGPAPEPQTVDTLQREILHKIVSFFSY
jgi:CRP-like cAMP-binding protein